MISGHSSLQGAYGTKVASALSRKPGGQSQLSAAFTLIKCNWGIGMMGMPYMLDQAGTIAGVIMFVASMALTQLSIVRLLEVDAELLRQHRLRKRSVAAAAIGSAAKRTSAPAAAGLTQPLWATDDSDSTDLDYAGIMQRSLGGIGEWLAIASIVVSAWGSCIAYLKFISDNLHSLFGLTTWGWVLVAAGPLAALAILDDVRFLAPASVVGLGSAFAFACVVVAGAFSHLSGEDVAHFFHTEPHVKWQTLPLAMSIAAFCNEVSAVASLGSLSSLGPRLPALCRALPCVDWLTLDWSLDGRESSS
jgi:amino acid permease